jgi:putative transposase
MDVKISVPEVVEFFKELQEDRNRFFEMMRFNVQEEVGKYLTRLMESELTHFLGRERYERKGKRKGNHRNGGYERRFTLKGIGEVAVGVPRDRQAAFKTVVLPRSKQYEEAIAQDLSMMFLMGISTRSLSLLSRTLVGRSISHEEVSRASRELTEAVERWRMRDLSSEAIEYLYIDGVHFAMRIGKQVQRIPMLVAIGVTAQKVKLVVGLQMGEKDSASCWEELFGDLKRRGLDGSKITLGVMDGLTGLERVFGEAFPQARIQRCQVHVARNVLAKVPRKIQPEVASDLRSIFYAASGKEALRKYEVFKERWGREIPSAMACLEKSLESCLTFFAFPPEEWISLRTTNVIERLNKEFKRRTHSMEIVAGEASCYRLLAFISLRMELHWRANPVGKVKPNLPFYRNFTQNS